MWEQRKEKQILTSFIRNLLWFHGCFMPSRGYKELSMSVEGHFQELNCPPAFLIQDVTHKWKRGFEMALSVRMVCVIQLGAASQHVATET